MIRVEVNLSSDCHFRFEIPNDAEDVQVDMGFAVARRHIQERHAVGCCESYQHVTYKDTPAGHRTTCTVELL